MEDLRLAATARMQLARNERTHRASVKVRANNGVVHVTYLPQDAAVATAIPEVCRNLPGLKDIRATMAMKELQPQVKQIQEQFKNDPKRMQIEMFNIYRKNGMKFMGMEGCFPILLQLPIFFAFYTTLNVAYELRGASWLWIPDSIESLSLPMNVCGSSRAFD